MRYTKYIDDEETKNFNDQFKTHLAPEELGLWNGKGVDLQPSDNVLSGMGECDENTASHEMTPK